MTKTQECRHCKRVRAVGAEVQPYLIEVDRPRVWLCRDVCSVVWMDKWRAWKAQKVAA